MTAVLLAARRWGSSLAGLLAGWALPMHLTFGLAVVACAACLALMPRSMPRRVPPACRAMALRAGAVTVLVSGAVTALASLLAQALGPQWAGLLTSPPRLAAAVVWELHCQGCPARVQDFLRGYIAGLAGRSALVAVFGVLIVPTGLGPALASGLVAALLAGWVSHVWMQRRSRLASLRMTPS